MSAHRDLARALSAAVLTVALAGPTLAMAPAALVTAPVTPAGPLRAAPSPTITARGTAVPTPQPPGTPQGTPVLTATSVVRTTGSLPPGAWHIQRHDSTPGGNSWSSVTCTSTRTCYVVGLFTTLSTTNGGRNWRPLPAAGSGNSIACPSTRTCYIVGGTDSSAGIKVTTDGGVTWHIEHNPFGDEYGEDLNAIACPSVRTCYAVGGHTGRSDGDRDGLILVTADGGATWRVSWRQQAPSGGVNELTSVACSGLQTCYAAGVAGLMVSSDGGKTWRGQQIGWSGGTDSVACPGVTTCYALGDGFAVTTNGGRTWLRRQGSVTSMTGRKDEYLYPFVLACPSVTICYAVGTEGLIIATADDGITWRRQPTPLQQGNSNPDPVGQDLSGVMCPSITTCYAVGENDLILARS